LRAAVVELKGQVAAVVELQSDLERQVMKRDPAVRGSGDSAKRPALAAKPRIRAKAAKHVPPSEQAAQP
jgi:hypothetical protein